MQNSVLEIIAYGAWNGGTVVDNSIYEKKGLSFKGGVPVNNKTIEERMGVRTRRTAGTDERIGVTALIQDHGFLVIPARWSDTRIKSFKSIAPTRMCLTCMRDAPVLMSPLSSFLCSLLKVI